jgi:hypothetical protein
MNEIVITVNGLIWFCGAVVAIGGAAAVIIKFLAPFKQLQERVSALESRFQDDHAELKKVETGIEKICKCTLAITDHELTGNSVDKLREAKDEMQDYLIQK